MPTDCVKFVRSLLAAACALVGVAGCAVSPARNAVDSSSAVSRVVDAPELIPSSSGVRRVADEVKTTGPLGLDELLALTRQQNPAIAAAHARVTEVTGQLVQAGLYPNPTVGYLGMQINDGPGTAGQQGVFVAQDIVTADKLTVAREAAEHALNAADWQATSQWHEASIRVRGAYYEYLTARSILRESEDIVAQFEEGLQKAENLAKAGTVLNYEVLRFRVELTQARNRVGAARERLTAAERLLATAVGIGVLPAPIAAAELPSDPPAVDFDAVMAASERTSSLQEAVALTNQARDQIRLADLQNVPNLQVQAAGMYDFAINAPMANVQIGVMLPFWHRNEGNILAAQGRLVQAQKGVDQARLRVRERLTAACQKYRNARRQLDLYDKQVIPDATTALKQVEMIYEAKGERFFETLDARRVLAQARVDYRQALGDAWQAISEIEGIVQATK
ncbi:MAG TPA: TolC family protein [Gemmataceae bacterium]|jgi:cobalt-zinc-cadmium efflux system outer membrane protein|nr:TolC family protein [Gemmataceae bacterium]